VEYYPNGKDFEVVDLPFNINVTKDLKRWISEAKKAVANLSNLDHVIVVITNHSDPDTEDLWLGIKQDGQPYLNDVENVSVGFFSYFILISTINNNSG
jgi:hypothetical protein